MPQIDFSRVTRESFQRRRSRLSWSFCTESLIARPLAKTSTQEQRQTTARAFAIDAAALAADSRCKHVVVLDVAGLSPVCDYFVIATGSSGRQMRSVAEDVMTLAEQRDFAPISHNGVDGESWMLADCVDVIVHIFNESSRLHYDLDNLWGDARKVEWKKP